MDGWWTRLEHVGEIVSDYRYEDVIIQAMSAEYDYVENKSYRDRDFDLESIRGTINNIFIDDLCRANCNGMTSVVDRDATIQAAVWRLNSGTNVTTTGNLATCVTTGPSRNDTSSNSAQTKDPQGEEEGRSG